MNQLTSPAGKHNHSNGVRIGLAVTLFLLTVGSVLTWSAYEDYGNTLAQEYRVLESQARLGDVHISGAFRSMNLVLQSAIDDMQATPRLPPSVIEQRQLSLLRQFPEIHYLITTDAAGQVRSAQSLQDPAGVPAVRALNAAQREYFTVHRDAKPNDYFRVQISRPFKTVTDRYTITVSKAMRAPDGALQGVALVSVSTHYFDSVLQQVLSNEALDAAAVHNRFGDIIHRLPNPEKYVGKNIADGEAFKAYLQSDQHLTRYAGVTKTDNVRRILVFSKVGDTNLDIGVSGQFDVVMAHWYRSAQMRAMIFVVVAVLSLALAWQFRRRQHARQAREHDERRFRAYFERSMVGMATVGPHRVWMDVNPALCQMLGYSTDLLVRKTWEQLLHPQDRAPVLAKFDRLLSGTLEEFEAEQRLVRSDGDTVIAQLAMRAVHKPDRSVDYAVVLVEDITRRKQAEEQLRSAHDQLEVRVAERTRELESAMDRLLGSQEALAASEARATLSTLIASVTHELGTPLGNSMMTGSTLSEQAAAFEKVIASGQIRRAELTDFVATMRTGSTLLMRNLNRLQELFQHFKQVAADQASEQQRPFDLELEVRAILATLAPSHKHSIHRVVVDIPSGISMNSRPGPLGQVLINLVNNAYLHAFDGRPQGGTVTITATADATHASLSIADNGIGIPEDVLAKVFDPFFSTKIGRGGTGLGMAIVKNLVGKALGGTIRVSSVVGVGTRFDIQLPLVIASEMPARNG